MNGVTINADIWKYDFETDNLFSRDKSLQYHSSISMGGMIIDIGGNGTPIGMGLLDASKKFGLSKIGIVKFRNTKVENVSVSYGINDINLQAGQTAMVC